MDRLFFWGVFLSFFHPFFDTAIDQQLYKRKLIVRVIFIIIVSLQEI